MIARDWRELSTDALVPVYEREIRRWRDGLAWDTTASWQAVEAGRQAGHAAGVAVIDDLGGVRGWSFGVLRAGTLQIGGAVADCEAATAALLAGLARIPEAGLASRWTWFGWCEAPGLEVALADAGALVSSYAYLRATPVARHPLRVPTGGAIRSWGAADAGVLPHLLARAYAEPDVMRPFAAGGLLAEWFEYTTQLLGTTACGTFDDMLSVVAASARGDPVGMAVVTRVSADTAHLAQLVVDSGQRGRGWGRALVEAVLDRAARARCRTVTLLVSRRNPDAVRLYERTGFTPAASFLSARCDVGPAVVHPRTSTSEAWPTGGVRTRR